MTNACFDFQDNSPVAGESPIDLQAGRLSIRNDFLNDVIQGLSQKQKSLPGKYLWDKTGSSIFDEICHSEAYYPAAREMALLSRAAEEISQIIGHASCLIEMGSGASHKTRILLDAVTAPNRYVAIDISDYFLESAAQRIQNAYPTLKVMKVCADYSMPLPPLPIDRAGRVLGLFLGNSIGNIDRDNARGLLMRLREALAPSWLLIGQDPNSDPEKLAKAYGGPLMAAFHKNVLVRMVRELNAQIDLDQFQHEPRFFDKPARTEPHLVAAERSIVRVGHHEFRLAAGESIRTDISRKYTKADFLALVAEAGWSPLRSWMDEDGLFGLHLLCSNP